MGTLKAYYLSWDWAEKGGEYTPEVIPTRPCTLKELGVVQPETEDDAEDEETRRLEDEEESEETEEEKGT